MFLISKNILDLNFQKLLIKILNTVKCPHLETTEGSQTSPPFV